MCSMFPLGNDVSIIFLAQITPDDQTFLSHALHRYLYLLIRLAGMPTLDSILCIMA